MATMTDLQAAERSMMELLEISDLPPPDEVEYRTDSLVFLWHGMKLAVIIDCDEPPAGEPPPQPAFARSEGGRI